MITLDETQKKKLRLSQLIAVMLLVVIPLVLLGLTQILNLPKLDPTANLMLFRILLIVAAAEPFVLRLVEHSNIKQFKQNKNLDLLASFQSMMVTRCGMLSAIFIYGFVVYMLSGTVTWMLCFYPIGVIATIIYFPRESTLENFIEKVQAP